MFASRLAHSLVLLGLLSATSAGAQLGKQEIVDRAAEASAVPELVREIETNCVDFPVDAGTIVELADRVPEEVLEALLTCRDRGSDDSASVETVAGAEAPAAAIDEEPACAIYRELLGAPALIDFPVQVASVTERSVALRIRPQKAWSEEKGAEGFESLMLFRTYLEKAKTAERLARRVPWVDEVSLIYERKLPTPEFAQVVEETVIRRCFHLTNLAEVRFEAAGPRDLILVDGELAAKGPKPFLVEAGERLFEVVSQGRRPHQTVRPIPRNARLTIPLPEREETPEACYRFDAQGTVKSQIARFRSQLVGTTLRLSVPLYQVITNALERALPSTHVVDGAELLFEPKTGDTYVGLPEDLMGRELGGLALGEFVSALTWTPPGEVAITGLRAKKSSVQLELRGLDGRPNILYLDFSRRLSSVPAEELERALCVVFSPLGGR